MRRLAIASILLSGCYDFQEGRRIDDPFERDPAPHLRLVIDRLEFPAGDPEALKLLETFRNGQAGIAGGSAYASNGMAAWSLSRDWSDRVQKAADHPSWTLQRATTFINPGESTRIVLVDRFDPLRDGRVRFFSDGVELEVHDLKARQTSFRAVVRTAGTLIDVDLVPVATDGAGRETSMTLLASRFSLEPGRSHLFTAHGQLPESAGSFLFINTTRARPLQVAVAIAVEVDEPGRVK